MLTVAQALCHRLETHFGAPGAALGCLEDVLGSLGNTFWAPLEGLRDAWGPLWKGT